MNVEAPGVAVNRTTVREPNVVGPVVRSRVTSYDSVATTAARSRASARVRFSPGTQVLLGTRSGGSRPGRSSHAPVARLRSTCARDLRRRHRRRGPQRPDRGGLPGPRRRTVLLLERADHLRRRDAVGADVPGLDATPVALLLPGLADAPTGPRRARAAGRAAPPADLVVHARRRRAPVSWSTRATGRRPTPRSRRSARPGTSPRGASWRGAPASLAARLFPTMTEPLMSARGRPPAPRRRRLARPRRAPDRRARGRRRSAPTWCAGSCLTDALIGTFARAHEPRRSGQPVLPLPRDRRRDRRLGRARRGDGRRRGCARGCGACRWCRAGDVGRRHRHRPGQRHAPRPR